jgi:DNA repair photolyase
MEDPFDFEGKIYAKAASADLLKRELRKTELHESIAIGTATDPYQPAERRFERTRAILEVFAKQRGRRLSITTKSDLILRDIELLREIKRGNVLSINITVTTLDATLARLMEPRAPRPDLRLAAVSQLAQNGIAVGVFPNPIMPALTDSEESLEGLASAAKAAGAQYFGGGPLFLMPCAKKVFLPFLAERFPHLVPQYERLYKDVAFLSGPYKEVIRKRVEGVRQRHGLSSAPTEYRPELWEESGQLALFPL